MTDTIKTIIQNPMALILIAALSGGGGHYAVMAIDPPRVDPFYGLQGKALDARVGKLEEVLRVEYPPKWLIEQVSRNTSRSETCEKLLLEVRAKH